MMQLMPIKVIRFMCWSMAIWGAGDAVNEAIQGRYLGAGVSIGFGIVWIFIAENCLTRR